MKSFKQFLSEVVWTRPDKDLESGEMARYHPNETKRQLKGRLAHGRPFVVPPYKMKNITNTNATTQKDAIRDWKTITPDRRARVTQIMNSGKPVQMPILKGSELVAGNTRATYRMKRRLPTTFWKLK